MRSNTLRLWITVTLFMIGALAFCAAPAPAEHLYVSDVGWFGGSNGDGTAAHPYWNITSAVIRARTIAAWFNKQTGRSPLVLAGFTF